MHSKLWAYIITYTGSIGTVHKKVTLLSSVPCWLIVMFAGCVKYVCSLNFFLTFTKLKSGRYRWCTCIIQYILCIISVMQIIRQNIVTKTIKIICNLPQYHTCCMYYPVHPVPVILKQVDHQLYCQPSCMLGQKYANKLIFKRW